jgi:hypothetical protein
VDLYRVHVWVTPRYAPGWDQPMYQQGASSSAWASAGSGWGPCVVRGPVDGRFLVWWVIDNIVWTDSWLSIAGAVIEGECPIFRWVEITSIWWLLTLTIRDLKRDLQRQCNRWTNSRWLPTLPVQDQPDHEDQFLYAIEERTRIGCEQS